MIANLLIETERLRITPLSLDQLQLYLSNDPDLATSLLAKHSVRTIPDALRDALKDFLIPHILNNPNQILYYTLWTGITKEHGAMIGDICFKGPPNEDMLEIGFGTYHEFQGNGYMTELVSGIINWTRNEHPSVKLTANTEITNQASIRVLEINGFKLS